MRANTRCLPNWNNWLFTNISNVEGSRCLVVGITGVQLAGNLRTVRGATSWTASCNDFGARPMAKKNSIWTTGKDKTAFDTACALPKTDSPQISNWSALNCDYIWAVRDLKVGSGPKCPVIVLGWTSASPRDATRLSFVGILNLFFDHWIGTFPFAIKSPIPLDWLKIRGGWHLLCRSLLL